MVLVVAVPMLTLSIRVAKIMNENVNVIVWNVNVKIVAVELVQQVAEWIAALISVIVVVIVSLK